MSTGDREANLPRWAQDELDRLRKDLQHTKDRLAQLTNRKDGVVIRDPYLDPTPVALAGERLEVTLDRHRLFGFRWMDEGYLEVTGDEQLSVEPSASNAVRVRPVERKS